MNHQITNHNNYQSTNGNITINNHTTFNHDGGVEATSTGASASSKTASPENDDNKESNAIPPVVRKEVLVDNQKRVILPNSFIPLVKKEITLAYAAEWICYLPFLSTKYEHAHPVYQEEDYKRDMKDIMTAIWDKCYQYGEDAFEELVIKNHSGILYNSNPLTKMEDVAAMYEGKGSDGENDPDPFHLAKQAYERIHSQTSASSPFMRDTVFRGIVNIGGSKFDPKWTIEQFPKDRKANNFNAHRMVSIAGKGVQAKKKIFNSISYGSAEIGLALIKPNLYHSQEQESSKAAKRAKTMRENRWFVPTDWNKFGKGRVYITVSKDRYAPLSSLLETPDMKQLRSAVSELELHQCAVRFIDKARSEGKSLDQVLDLVKTYFKSENGDCNPPSESPGVEKRGMSEMDEIEIFKGIGMSPSFAPSNLNQWMQPHPQMPPHHQHQIPMQPHPQMPPHHQHQIPRFQPVQEYNNCGPPVSDQYHFRPSQQQQQLFNPYQNHQLPSLPPYQNQPPSQQYPHNPQPPITQPGNIPQGDVRSNKHDNHDVQHAPFTRPDNGNNPYDPVPPVNHPSHTPFTQAGNIPSQGDESEVESEVNPFDIFGKQASQINHEATNGGNGGAASSGNGDITDTTDDDQKKESDDEYEVAQIIAKDHVKGKYLIEWVEDYDGEHGEDRYTWEPTFNIKDKQLVESFESTWKDMACGVRFTFHREKITMFSYKPHYFFLFTLRNNEL